MLRWIIALLCGLLLTASAVQADDVDWDEWEDAWDEYNGETTASEDSTPDSVSASDPIHPLASEGDPFHDHLVERGLLREGEGFRPGMPPGMMMINPDQVFGPLWGVPGDAVGLEGYDPYIYMLYRNADPDDIPEEYRGMVLERRRMNDQSRELYYGGPAPGHNSGGSEEPRVTEDDPDALAIRETDEDDWLE